MFGRIVQPRFYAIIAELEDRALQTFRQDVAADHESGSGFGNDPSRFPLHAVPFRPKSFRTSFNPYVLYFLARLQTNTRQFLANFAE
jgi:hypothetical protein